MKIKKFVMNLLVNKRLQIEIKDRDNEIVKLQYELYSLRSVVKRLNDKLHKTESQNSNFKILSERLTPGQVNAIVYQMINKAHSDNRRKLLKRWKNKIISLTENNDK